MSLKDKEIDLELDPKSNEYHKFDTGIAKQYGIVQAIIIFNLKLDIQKKIAHNFDLFEVMEGEFIGEYRTWSESSVKGFNKEFDYLTPTQIRTALDFLVEKGILLKGFYSKNKFDRVAWYSFAKEENILDYKYIQYLRENPKRRHHLPYKANVELPHRANDSLYIKENNISSHSSDKDILLEEKQTNIFFETANDLVSENLTKNIDGNCTLPSQDSRKPRKTKKNEITEEELAIKAEKSQYTKEFKRLWYEKAKPKLEMQGYNAISKLYDKYGLDKANHIRDYILAMYGSNQLSIGKHKNHDDALMSYQDPNQETPKYLSNSLYERQSRYKGGDIPDDKMISSEATFYASLEWHFSDRYEGAELVKKVREFIQENNCKYKNY